MVEDTGRVDGGTVGKVSAVVEVEAHEGVAGLQTGEQHGHVGLCAGVRLHIGPLGTEKLFHAVDGDLLALVHDLAAAVVALARKAFSVFVGHNGTHGLHHLGADKVLGSDQLNAVGLALTLLLDKIEDLFVSFHI